MASQRVPLMTIAGCLAEVVWTNICRWSDARTTVHQDEWSYEQRPVEIQREVDAFIDTISSSGFTPPILYRSEHVDLWSMGDVYQGALVKANPDYTRQLFTRCNEVIATWVNATEQIVADEGAWPETLWLYNRINEAVDAWSEMSERRLIILNRAVLGGLWTDQEVSDSLLSLPPWWTKNEGTQ